MIGRTVVIGLLSFLTLIDLFGAQALLPTLTELYGVDRATMGFAVNASTIGMAAAGLAVAYFSRHIDRKRGIWISLALLSIPTLLLGLVTSIDTFFALRIAQGILMSTAFTLTMAYLAEECTGPEAAAAMAAYITGNVVSNLLGRLLAANFAEKLGVSGSFWAFSVLNLAGAVLAVRFLAAAKPREARVGGESPIQIWRKHLSDRGLCAGFLIGFLILFVFLGVFTYINFVLSEAPFLLSQTQLGLVYLVFLPAVFTTPIAGRLAAKRGVFQAFLISMGVAMVGLLAVLSSNLAIVLLGLALIGIGTFCAQAVTTGYIGSHAKGDRAAASGLYLASYYVGGFSGAWLMGMVFEGSGWNAAIGALFLLSGLSVVVARHLRPVPDVSKQELRSLNKMRRR